MKNVILKIGGLVVIGMLCTLVPASLYAGCGDGLLSIKVTPSTLNLSNKSPEKSAVIKAHISGVDVKGVDVDLVALLAAHIDKSNPFQITCINVNGTDIGLLEPIAPIEGMASIEDDVLSIGFYRRNLMDAIKTLKVVPESATITVAQTGTGSVVKIRENLTLPLDGKSTILLCGSCNLTGFTNLNLGTPSEPVIIDIAVVEAGETGGTSCTLYYGVITDPTSISLNTGACSISLTNVELRLSATSFFSTDPVTFNGGVSISGVATGVGLSGTDTIKLK